MKLTDDEISIISKRILHSRLRIITKNGFFGILLMNACFTLTDEIEHAATDCVGTIYLNPCFMKDLTDRELDYILEHEIMHIVLHHGIRGKNFDQARFNIAADIVVNANILAANDYDMESISLGGKPERWQAPNGESGDKFTVEQLYRLIEVSGEEKIKGPGDKSGDTGSGAGDDGKDEQKDNRKNKNKNKKPGNKSGSGSDGFATGRAKKLKVTPRLPGDDGWDEHLEPRETVTEEDEKLCDVWVQRIEDAAEAMKIRIENGSSTRGTVPAFAERMIKELRNPQIDWRQILNDFVQEDICDYSFSPPDRRFGESPFFLPDFNEKDDSVKDILFMIDTSASMKDDMVAAAYSEIKGAIDQFGGKLKGWLGFFDAAVIEPKPFEGEEEFKVIKAYGGGGTDFQIIFEYVAYHMIDNKPVSIIILTDGYAPFPKEKLADGIPVLWLINNEDVKPPWGKVARIRIEE